MNYYERHIGDYLKDTAHLSLLEHGVYGRMLDVYYTRESAIPQAQVERLIGVRSKEEREVLRNVVAEFFTVDGDVLRHSRCDREIARYQEKQRKAAASANARWGKGAAQSERSANGDANVMRTHMRTHSEGNAPSNQTPDTSNQNQGASVKIEKGGPVGPAHADFENRDSGPGSAAADAMRAAGVADASATNPKLLALLAAGITVDELKAAAAYAVRKGVADAYAYALSRAEGQRRDAATMAALPDAPASAALDQDSEAAVQALAVSLGMDRWERGNVDARGVHEPWSTFKARVRRAQAERAVAA